MAQHPLEVVFEEIESSDDELPREEPLVVEKVPLTDDLPVIGSPPLAPKVIVEPPSSLVLPPSQELIEPLDHLSDKADEESRPGSRERSVSVRASSLLTDAPSDERMDALAQEVSMNSHFFLRD